MQNIVHRDWPADAARALQLSGLPALLARLYAARGIGVPADLPTRLNQLLPYTGMLHCEAAGARLADAIERRQRLLVVADYDADGATACALAVNGLTALGAQVEYLVPNRFEYGYGLSPEIARLAAERQPDLLITVDNGIAAHEGIAEARRLGMDVLVTDHHLAGETLPDCLIVNPNQPGCNFASKHLAGVGVMFYVLMALRAEQRKRGVYKDRVEPNLAELLDLVALGTIADVVRLDANNRLLVAHGIQRIRDGKARPGMAALFAVAGKDPRRAGSEDLGFSIGPRLNAAGRMADMSVGIECLLAPDLPRAQSIAAELDRLNRERREVETGMQEQALGLLDHIQVEDGASLCLFDPGWHQGVVGLLASRLKERYHRPTLVFAEAGDGLLRGSGRSIPGLHLRDALDLVDRRQPGLMLRFGGHAMAAGLTLKQEGFAAFAETFEQVARASLSAADLTRVIETDGELAVDEINLANADLLRQQVWGQGFPAPLFVGQFHVQSQRLVGEKHLRLRLASGKSSVEAMLFNHPSPLPERILATYRLEVNEWNGSRSLQLTLGHWQEG